MRPRTVQFFDILRIGTRHFVHQTKHPVDQQKVPFWGHASLANVLYVLHVKVGATASLFYDCIWTSLTSEGLNCLLPSHFHEGTRPKMDQSRPCSRSLLPKWISLVGRNKVLVAISYWRDLHRNVSRQFVRLDSTMYYVETNTSWIPDRKRRHVEAEGCFCLTWSARLFQACVTLVAFSDPPYTDVHLA